MVPTLETERLVLRAHRVEDFPGVAALWSDPAVVRFISGVPQTLEESWSRLLRYAGHWRLLGFGYWAVEEKATGNFLGEVGFADMKRAIEPPLGPLPKPGGSLPARHMVRVLPWKPCERFTLGAPRSSKRLLPPVLFIPKTNRPFVWLRRLDIAKLPGAPTREQKRSFSFGVGTQRFANSK